MRLREMIEAQRQVLLVHDPGTRLGDDPENLHQHRVAARRVRVYLRAARGSSIRRGGGRWPGRSASSGEVSGPVRDLDVLLEHLRDELERLEEPDRHAGDALLARSRSSATPPGVVAGHPGRRRIPGRARPAPSRAEACVRCRRLPLERNARREFRRLVEAVERLGDQPDEDALHRLRISSSAHATRPNSPTSGANGAAASSPTPGRYRTSSASTRMPSSRSSGCGRSP